MATKAFIAGYQPGGAVLSLTVLLKDSTDTYTGAYGVDLAITPSDTPDTIIAAIDATLATFWPANGIPVPDSTVWLIAKPNERSFSNPSLAVNTARRASTVRNALVFASVEIDSALTLLAGAKGKVEPQYADDSAFTTNVITCPGAFGGNTGTLTIGLNTVDAAGGVLAFMVPANKYYRLKTTNITGTPTYGTPVIQEVLL